jgi:hypothetical protein
VVLCVQQLHDGTHARVVVLSNADRLLSYQIVRSVCNLSDVVLEGRLQETLQHTDQAARNSCSQATVSLGSYVSSHIESCYKCGFLRSSLQSGDMRTCLRTLYLTTSSEVLRPTRITFRFGRFGSDLAVFCIASARYEYFSRD